MSEPKSLTGKVFFAGGENGLRAFSQDGVNWTHQQNDREGTILDRVAFANGHCVTAGRYGGERLCFSTKDGVTWERITLPGRRYVSRVEVLYVEKDRFQMILNSDGNIPQLYQSKDGLKWDKPIPLLDDPKVLRRDAHMRGVAIGEDGTLVAYGDYGARLYRKANQDKWTALKDVKAIDTLIDLEYGNGVFVGSGLHALRMSSQDGIEWTERIVGEEGEHLNAMIWDGQQFVGVGQGATYFSNDGQSWKRVVNENAPTAAIYGNGLFIGVLWPGRILTSKDGVKWTEVHKFPNHILSLGFGVL